MTVDVPRAQRALERLMAIPGISAPAFPAAEVRKPLRRRVAGRRGDDEAFVFDSTGTALQDVAVASLATRRAMERDEGVEVAFAARSS